MYIVFVSAYKFLTARSNYDFVVVAYNASMVFSKIPPNSKINIFQHHSNCRDITTISKFYTMIERDQFTIKHTLEME